MSTTKEPANLPVLNETPKFWDDDMKMDAWFAPFRNRDLNPLNYDNKMAFWKSNVEFYCEKTRKFCFTLAQVRSFFVRNGKMPNCLQLVFENLIRDGSIRSLSEYENSLSDNTWSGWALNTFVSSPIKWSFKKVINTVVAPPTLEIDENTEYIHLPSFNKQVDELYKIITKDPKDDLLTYEDVKTILSNTTRVKVSLKTIRLMVHRLEEEKKAHVVFENKHCNTHLIKFSTSSLPVIPINDSEISVYVLQAKEKVLIEKLQSFEAEKENLQIEVKKLLMSKMKNMARNTLKKQKELEKRIAKLVNVLENIQNLLCKVQDTEADSQILESYKVGAHALKSGITKGGLSLKNVDNTMDEIENVLDMHSEIQETLGQMVGTQTMNDADLEDELAELLLGDVPSVPPEAPSPSRKSEEFQDVEEDRSVLPRRQDLDSLLS